MVERVYSDGGTQHSRYSSPNLNSDTYGGYIPGILYTREKNTSVNETAAGFYKEIINSFGVLFTT